MESMTHRVLAIVALVMALGLAGGVAVAAQGTDATQPPDLSGAIHEGTCDAPGAAVYQVGDFTRIQEADVVGSRDIDFTLMTQRTIETDLDTLFGPTTTYIFAVLDNQDPAAGPIACGELGGMNVNGQIVVAIAASAGGVVDEGDLVGVAVFGNTEPTGPTTQPATVPGQLPVQAYLSEAALAPAETPTAVVTQTATTVPASPTAAPSTPVPTEQPSTPAPTQEPTVAPTEEPTEIPTEVPTEEPTEVPTEIPTEEPTELPTEEATET